MATWKFRMKYVDVREIYIDADTKEEAREKMHAGEFEAEHTIDFYADDLIHDLEIEE